MSADNGIYIAKFPEGYRVAYGAAIENIDYYDEGTKKHKAELKNYFGDSKVYISEARAWKQARKLYKEWGYTEYGVCYVGEYESFEKPPKQK